MGLNACNPPSSYKRESLMSKMLIFSSFTHSFNGKLHWRKFHAHTHTSRANHSSLDFRRWWSRVLCFIVALQSSLSTTMQAKPSLSCKEEKFAFFFLWFLARFEHKPCLGLHQSCLSSWCKENRKYNGPIALLSFHLPLSSFNGKLGSIFSFCPQISYEASLSHGDHLPST